jgi:hypothetical protein
VTGAATRGRQRLHRLHRVWWIGCAWLLAFMLAARAVRYAVTQLPGPLDRALGDVLTLESLLFFGSWIGMSIVLELVVAVGLVALLVFRRHLVARHDGAWGTHPILHSLVWLAFVLAHAAFDVSPVLAAPCLASLAALAVPDSRVARSAAVRLAAAGAVPGGVAYVAWYGDGWSVAALALWLGALALLVRAEGLVLWRDRLWLALAGVAGVQLFAAIGPVLWPTHGGRLLVPEMAYGFCESERHQKLYAALTRCATLPNLLRGRADCLRGTVAEFDLRDLSLRAEHGFFSDDWYGRVEQLVCTDDTVEVGLNGMVIDGREARDGTLSFEIADPTRFVRNRVGPRQAHRIAFDAKRGALFYAPEWGNGMRRYDIASGRVDWVRLGDWLRPRGDMYDSFEMGPESIDPRRDSLFVAEWIGGSFVREIDLATAAEIARFAHHDGGAVGAAVDSEFGRLYVVGLWGMEVIELKSGRTIHRARLGLLSRIPVIDAKRGLLYVASTVEGRIHVFDRATLEPRGTLPIGFGVRLLHLSPATDRLYASSARAAFWWPAGALVR